MPVLLFYGKRESDKAGRFAMLLILVKGFFSEKKMDIQNFSHNSRDFPRDPET